mmetsp:Transcript_14868/g.22360  ORF Transcript_14868/g.22360 Transcript_14868/m.22360 type:complete len:236 (+) Transcript_14868:106-813(+)|eukprot:CAMPEP_0185028388 /NCGR_PEP_ID=MMETSP1103-20130426/14046_1 /TAXON_ID=36769 /ORGANISM="Paraphysomonas bandaiensis, Strain Caron Lab Isolate" /LENGTH=235 /DNA_ID=CAMNT_0027562787 /DNA_START=53 /DNA_END=760 /DNA_ORIENTATION=-
MTLSFGLYIFAILLLQGSATQHPEFTISVSMGTTDFNRQTFQLDSLPRDFRDGIPVEHIDSFKSLLKSNGLFTIKINSDGFNSSSPAVSASIRACDLQKSGFKEDISLHVDRDFNVVGIHYTSPVTALPRPCDPKKVPDNTPLAFYSKIKVIEAAPAQSIPIQAQGPRPPYLQNVKLGVEDVAEQKPAANQSFLFKYWYIVLPLVLITLFGGGEAPPAEGGAAAGSGGAQQAKKA